VALDRPGMAGESRLFAGDRGASAAGLASLPFGFVTGCRARHVADRVDMAIAGREPVMIAWLPYSSNAASEISCPCANTNLHRTHGPSTVGVELERDRRKLDGAP
jgi:hypothetical protein